MPELLALTMTRVLHSGSCSWLSIVNGLRGFRSEYTLKVGPTSLWTDTGLLLGLVIATAATDTTDQLRHFLLLIQMGAFLYNRITVSFKCDLSDLRCPARAKDTLDFKNLNIEKAFISNCYVDNTLQ